MTREFANLDPEYVDEYIEQHLHSFSPQQASDDARCLQDLAYLYRKEEVLFRVKERLMITDQPNMNRLEQGNLNSFPLERASLSSQPSMQTRRNASIWPRITAVLAAVLLVGMLIGVLQLTRLHPAPSTSVAHSGSTDVFQGGMYLVKAKDNGDGYPNVDGTTMIPHVRLAPAWSYSLTMTRVKGNTVPSYGDMFGLILAYTKEQAYALTFSDHLGTPEILLFEYNWSMNHQYQESNGQPAPFTPLPGGGVREWVSSNPFVFHTGLNVVNTVKVTATAYSLTISINGQSAGTIQNIAMGSGQFGMFVDTTGTEVKFQNVLITQP